MYQKIKISYVELTTNVIKCQSKMKTNKIITMQNKNNRHINTPKRGENENINMNIDIIFENKFTWGSMTICTLQINDCKH